MPFETRLMNITELVNETTILIVAYHLLFFSDFATSPTDVNNVGWSLIFLVLGNILFNTIVFIYMVICNTTLYVKRYVARKAFKNRAT